MIVSTAPVSVHSPYVKTLGRPAEPDASSAPPVDTVAAPSISSAGGTPRGHLGIIKTVGTVGLLAASIVTGVLGAGTANAQAAVEAPPLEYAPSGWHNISSSSCPMPQNAAQPGVEDPARTQAILEAEGKLLEAYASRDRGLYKINDNCTVVVERNEHDPSISTTPQTFVDFRDAKLNLVARMAKFPSMREVGVMVDGRLMWLTTTESKQSVWESALDGGLNSNAHSDMIRYGGGF